MDTPTLPLEFIETPPRLGKDELNLTEFPFALLATRAPKNAPLLMEFRDGEKEWSVEGSQQYGLPMAVDVEVYLVLMEVSRDRGFPAQVEFSRWDVIQRLGWGDSGRSYDRFQLALDRLVSVTIRTKHAFVDGRSRVVQRSKAFHILETYDLTESRQDRREELSLYPSWFRWSQEILGNLQSGYIKSLDLGLFLSLKSAISQALYRYLDRRRHDGKPTFQVALQPLAFQRLGMSRTYYPSEIKHKLKPAHDELIRVGFLSSVDYAEMRNGEEMVIYRFAPPRQVRPVSTTSPALPPPALSPLAQRLVNAGLSRATAVEFAASRPKECEDQLAWLPFREKVRDSGATLVTAIREGWTAPPAWLDAQKRAVARERKAEQQSKQEAAAAERAAAEQAFADWWSAQPEAQRLLWSAQALEELCRQQPTMAEHYRKRPNGKTAQAEMRPILKRLSGWDGA